MVADASMLEKLLVKDFSNFHNRIVGSFRYACLYVYTYILLSDLYIKVPLSNRECQKILEHSCLFQYFEAVF